MQTETTEHDVYIASPSSAKAKYIFLKNLLTRSRALGNVCAMFEIELDTTSFYLK